MSTRDSLQAAAEAHLQSYADSVGPKYAQGDVMTGTKAVVSHYLTTAVLCTHQTLIPIGNGDKAIAVLHHHREKLKAHGIGVQYKLKNPKVQVLSTTSALCWATWEVVSADKKHGHLEWTNIYYYRVLPDGTAGWDILVSDDETEVLLGRFPDWFEGLEPPEG